MDKLNQVMAKFYIESEVQARIDAIKVFEGQDKDKKELSWKETFCDRRYNKAAWIGIAISAFVYLNGCISVVFYSSKIF